MDILRNDDENCGFTIYWRIENFGSEPSFDYLESQIFKIRCLDSNWKLKIKNDKILGSLDAFLYKITNTTPSQVYFSLSILTGSGWINKIMYENSFEAGSHGYGDEILSLDIIKKKELFYLPNGSLTIKFQILNDQIRNKSSQRLMISRLIKRDYLRHMPIQTFTSLKPSDLFSFPLSYEFQCNSQANSEYQTSKVVETQQTQTDTTYSFKDLDDLLQLFKEKEFTFVALRTPSKEFMVHKAVLCAKSPVFNAMFEKKMKESDSNVVDINDIDSQTMALFVKFLHFQPVEELEWGAAVSLYYAADKYQIDSLKEHCVSLLKKELSIENICDLLLLADLHEDDDLMDCASEYFCQHSKAIFLSQQWRDILGHTELVANLLCKLAKTTH